jgi:uncharacterized protein
MRWVRAMNVARSRTLGDRVGVADRWWLRLRGLSGKSNFPSGEGLLLSPCRAVHMIGMKFPIDVVFLDSANRVVATYERLAPGRRTQWHRAARTALELPAGTLAATGTMTGDLIEYHEEDSR